MTETVKKEGHDRLVGQGERSAEMRVAVRRILRRHGYPPDKQKRATALVIEQAD